MRAIRIASDDQGQQCKSCGARDYEAYTKPADVDELFELTIGNVVLVLCADCLQELAQTIHPHRTGS